LIDGDGIEPWQKKILRLIEWNVRNPTIEEFDYDKAIAEAAYDEKCAKKLAALLR
jgi:hypothetical protein